MKTIVLVKQVPDTETNIKLGEKSINEAGTKWIISPYDEFAIEEGIKIREKSGGEVIAVAVGPERVKEALRTAFAMGVDKAVHIHVENYVPFDVNLTAELIANYAKQEKADLIIAGRQSIDSNSSQVAIQVAALLEIPHIGFTLNLEINGTSVKAKQEVDGGTAEVEASFPLLITAQKGLNEPRYPSLKGIMTAKKKPIDVKTPADLGNPSSKIELVGLEPPPPRIQGRILQGSDPKNYAEQLVKSLREEAKVI